MTTGDAGRLRGAARLYADPVRGPGWKVFPTWGIRDGKCECGEPHASPKDMGKHPVGGHGHKDATSDPDVIEAHWPDPALGVPSAHNVAVPCDANNLLVVDVDPRSGGLESWDRLESAVGGMPATLTALTGRWGTTRGRHHYFRVPSKLAHASFHGKLAEYPGIDFKHQGYVLAAPSMHGSGEEYEWTVRGGPLSVEPADLPDELTALILKGRRRSAGTGGGSAAETFGVLDWGGKRIDVDAVLAKGIHEGDRVNTLYPIMCALANKYPVAEGHGAAAFRMVLRGMNAKFVHPPLPDDELDFQMQRAIDFVVENPKNRSLEAVLGQSAVDWASGRAAELAAEAEARDARAYGGAGGSASVPVALDPEEIAAGMLSRGEAVSTPVPAGARAGGLGDLPADVDKQDLSALAPGQVARFSHTDQGNAARLSNYYEGRVHYSVGGGWYVWDDERRTWSSGSTGEILVGERAQVLPQLIARELAGLTPGDDAHKKCLEWIIASKSTGRIESAVKQWKFDTRRVLAPIDSWDADPLLLGARNGVVDLRGGRLLPAEPGQRITKQAAVAYEPGTRNPRWDQFLEEATGGDRELQRYLQLAAGYTLTGLRKFEVLFLISGPPGTGKSTFLNVLGALLGRYHTTVPTEVLVEGPGGVVKGNVEQVLAELHGKRMAEISEWPENRNTREDVIKMLTGESLTRGRRLYQDAFEFQSTAKLWIGTNVRPRINDKAMWRRIRAVHFGHRPEKPDPDLKPFLLDPEGGLPAVLSWAVEGAQLLLGSSSREPLGLDASAHVRAETEEYRRHEDRLGLFLSEETAEGPGASVQLSALFRTYEEWAADRGEQPMKRISFDRKLRESGLDVEGEGRGAVLKGRMVRPRAVQPPGPATGIDWTAAVSVVRPS